jgi:hypothetical protein
MLEELAPTCHGEEDEVQEVDEEKEGKLAALAPAFHGGE